MARKLDMDFDELYKVVIHGKPGPGKEPETYVYGPYASPDTARDILDRAVYRMRMQGWWIEHGTIYTSGTIEWVER